MLSRAQIISPDIGSPTFGLLDTSLNKLQSYCRTSALGPAGHCTSRFKRAVCISCRPRVDVHKGGRGVGPAHVYRGEGGQKPDFFVDVVDGWPLSAGNPSSHPVSDANSESPLKVD